MKAKLVSFKDKCAGPWVVVVVVKSDFFFGSVDVGSVQ